MLNRDRIAIALSRSERARGPGPEVLAGRRGNRAAVGLVHSASDQVRHRHAARAVNGRRFRFPGRACILPQRPARSERDQSGVLLLGPDLREAPWLDFDDVCWRALEVRLQH